MVLRLLLVGLVAGLGLSLPSRSDFDTMARSAQHWMNDRLAEWDTHTSSDQGTYVFVVEPTPTPAPFAAADPTSLVVATPVPDSDEGFADALGESVASFAQDELAARTRATDPVVKSLAELVPSDPASLLAISLPTGPAFAPNGDLTTPELAFGASSEQTGRDLSADVVARKSIDQPDSSFEVALEETVVSFTRDALFLGLARADQTPRGEPLEIDGDLYAGEAYALNRLSDGISTPVPPDDAAGKNPNRLTNAVRLTREAVFAWASLLHGPAIVTIAR